MATYQVKEEYREVVTGIRTYTVEANSTEEAWNKVDSGDVTPDSETKEYKDSDYSMISAFIVVP
ncbi:gp23 [Shigella phage Buco]|uniref:Uncharacterized protein n=1 Tax=Shigella phage Buco TaxID=2530183 RepID=A0A482JJM7_9CAUD|nr:gp23 [Shigella phage Buco]QBP32923.1 hypothetical protein HRP29_gp23 [Shigella phage Buco]